MVFWVGLDLDPKKNFNETPCHCLKPLHHQSRFRDGLRPSKGLHPPRDLIFFSEGRDVRPVCQFWGRLVFWCVFFFLISEKTWRCYINFKIFKHLIPYIYIISYMYIYGRYEYNVFKGRSFKPWILQSQIIPVNTVYSQQNSNGESLYQRKGITFILPLWANPKGNNSTKDPSGEFQEGLFIAASQSSPKIATWIGWWNLGPICTNSNGFSGI